MFRNLKYFSETPEICSKLLPTSIYIISEDERGLMKDTLNNKRKNPRIMETFLNLNGINATDEELDILQTNIDTNNYEYNDDGNLDDNHNEEDNTGASLSSVNSSNTVTEV